MVYLFLFKFSTFRCLKFLGSRHPTLVLPLVPELLSTHPYFDTPEPDMDDPACILHTPKDLKHTQRSRNLSNATHRGASQVIHYDLLVQFGCFVSPRLLCAAFPRP